MKAALTVTVWTCAASSTYVIEMTIVNEMSIVMKALLCAKCALIIDYHVMLQPRPEGKLNPKLSKCQIHPKEARWLT